MIRLTMVQYEGYITELSTLYIRITAIGWLTFKRHDCWTIGSGHKELCEMEETERNRVYGPTEDNIVFVIDAIE